jgi:hypothetical protein
VFVLNVPPSMITVQFALMQENAPHVPKVSISRKVLVLHALPSTKTVHNVLLMQNAPDALTSFSWMRLKRHAKLVPLTVLHALVLKQPIAPSVTLLTSLALKDVLHALLPMTTV